MTRERKRGAAACRCALRVFGCGVLGVVVGAVLGSWIGGLLGDPEGEGFLGFLYGLRIGGALGVFVGVVWALRSRRARAL